MNNFEVLNHYSIPSDVLMDMLNTYRLLGMNKQYEELVGEKKLYLLSDVIEKDVFYLVRFLKLNISDNRLRLLITKNSIPKSKEEQVVIGLKKVITTLQHNSLENLSFNGSDFLDYLNIIYGKKNTEFSKETFKAKANIKPISIRLTYERVLEEYHNYLINKKFEPIFLSVVTYMEVANIKPYSNHNELANYLMLYYMILKSDVKAFSYVSFFEIFSKMKEEFDESVKKGSYNYRENYLQTNDTVRIIFKIISLGYKELDTILKNYAFQSHAYKSDVIEETIYRKVPQYFTKDDVRHYHPDASDSTINRILFKLRDEGVIMPLGKGRSARWMKILNENDPRMIFGGKYEQKD